VKLCLSGEETRKSGSLAWWAMCDHAVWWAGKKRAEEPVKMETGCAGIKIASPFTISLQVRKNWNQNCQNVLQFLLRSKLGI
jgi:hypothetical protein